MNTLNTHPFQNKYSIYIHLPFCLSKCWYCDFCSTQTIEVPFEQYRRSVALEWRRRQEAAGNLELTSIYIGGGTPSLWSSKELKELLKGLPANDDLEVTVEVNPGDGPVGWFKRLADCGVNRFSIGAQALDDSRLKWLGRRHNSAQVKQAVEAARRVDSCSVGVDLIYGTPGQSQSGLLEELGILTDMGVDHVSAYELTISEGTRLKTNIESSEVDLPEDDVLADQWRLIGDVLGHSGLSRYEVSNYAASSHQCRHNKHYWRGGLYVGLGAGAHGFLKDSSGDLHRYSNGESIEDYMGGIGIAATVETIEPLTHAREKVMLGLRTTEGLIFENVFLGMPSKIQREWMGLLRQAKEEGLVNMGDARASPTEKGMLHADTLAARFF